MRNQRNNPFHESSFLGADTDAMMATMTRLKERSRAKWSAMNLLGYSWTILVNLFTLFVVFAIFETAYESFQTIVYSVLLLIYLNVITIGAVLSQQTVKNRFFMHHHFKEIKQLLHQEEDESEKEEVDEALKLMDKVMVKFYINAFFSFILFLIAIFQLLGSL